MSSIPFWKMQTVGNDFVLLHEEDLSEYDESLLAEILCDRKYGIGSDGLIVVQPYGEKLIQRFYNPDGSEDFCGNGLRCSGLHCFQQGWVGQEFWVEQLGFSVPIRVEGNRVTATMPWATTDPSHVPICHVGEWWEKELEGFVGSALSTGSTHFVIFVDELPGDDVFLSVSPKIEVNEMFPEKTSVIWTKAHSQNDLEIRIWERAVGETLGCGTGASAAAAAWARKSGQPGYFDVRSKGGVMTVELEKWDGIIQATSIPEETYPGRIPFELISSAKTASSLRGSLR